LLVIGVAVVTGFSRRKAAFICLSYWMAAATIGLIPTSITSFMLPRTFIGS
jgi:hypothetical protein